MTSERSIVLFDGVCNLCNNTVDRIIRNDKHDRFLFCALQSEKGKNLLAQFHIDPSQTDSIVLIEGRTAYIRSDAALHISKKMSGLYPLLQAGYILPKFIRDGLYNWIAKNRYRWFGKKETCRIPTAKEQEKFI